jgi:16S rRNA (cytosine967-C5)-methyltransferase
MQANAVQRLAQAALETWTHISARVETGEPADVALQSWWTAHRYYGSRDRRFIAESIFSCFRWKGWLATSGLTPATQLGLAYLMDASEPHPAAEVLLNLGTGPRPATSTGGRTVEEKAAWLAEVCQRDSRPAMSELVPAWLSHVVAETDRDPFIRSIQQRPPTWLRTRRGEAESIITLLKAEGCSPRQHPRMPEAIALDRSPPSGLLHNLARRGCLVQDIHSQCVGLLCQPQPGERWWDMCAGAGGKTLHLAELLGPRGHILASDVRESALLELERRARLAQMRGLHLRLLRLDEPPPGAPFDGILIDAPCSGTGTWGRNPDARWRTSLETVERMAATQLTLLQRALPYLKPGGTLVFSTCSITRPESQAVLDQFLGQPTGIQPCTFTLPIAPETHSGSCTLWPITGPGIGMFISKLRIVH